MLLQCFICLFDSNSLSVMVAVNSLQQFIKTVDTLESKV